MVQDPFRYFRVEAHELVDQLGKGVVALERGDAVDVLPKMLRLAHTLKGAARVVRRPDIAEFAHAIEGALAPYRDQPAVPPRSIHSVLGFIDDIATALAGLSGGPASDPSAAPEAGGAATPGDGSRPADNAGEDLRTVFAEVADLDFLLDGVTETHAQLSSLRRVTAQMDRLREMAEQLSGGLLLRREREGTTRGGDKLLATADELLATASRLSREFASTHERMERELGQVHDAAQQLRLVPVGALFAFLERAAADAAATLGKSVTFAGRGGEIRLDAHLLRVVHEALLQLVRNAVAHGIEPEAERVAAGKPASGSVVVEVVRRGRSVVFRCSDDGRGIDAEAVRGAALRKGVALPPGERGTAGLVELLLAGGISTSSGLSHVAGRGVGMDIVRSVATRVGGRVTAESVPGKGSAFELWAPVSLAATEALLIAHGDATIAVPFDAVRHVQHAAGAETYRTARGEQLIHDGRGVPFAPLAQLLDPASRPAEVSAAVVVADGSRLAAIGVGRIRGTGNLVFRAVPDLAPVSSIVAGVALDADGNAQLVLDPQHLIAAVTDRRAEAQPSSATPRPVLVIDDSLTTRMLEQSILESAGYEVELAVSAEEGLAAARRKPYALFLVDVEMPGMDGFSFVETIRGDPGLRDIPAILVTSRNAPEDLKRGRDVGAQDYVVKSEFNQAGLLARIRELMAARV